MNRFDIVASPEYLVDFVETGHRYTVFTTDDRGDLVIVDDPRMKCVTSYIENDLFPKFEAGPTLAGMRAKGAMDPKYDGCSDEQIKYWWDRNGEHSSRMGTAMHALLESYFRAVAAAGSYDDARLPEEPPDEPLEMPWEIVSGRVLSVEQLSRFVDSIRDRLIPILVEHRMYDPDLHLCGSLDVLFLDVITGELELCDWKRYKDFTRYSKYGKKGRRGRPAELMDDCKLSHVSVQVNAYRRMALRILRRAISKQRVVVFYPDAKDWDSEPIPINDDLVRSMISDRNRV
jgi:hypothetical protein